MRRVKIAAVMLIVILAYSVGSLFVLRSCNHRLEQCLYAVGTAWKSEDSVGAMEAAEQLNRYWAEYEKTVTMIVHDDSLAELNISVAKLPPLISSDSDEVESELESALHQLEYIYNEECPYWFNIL